MKTVRNADQILVLNDSHIVQRGTHDQLIREKGLYADFVSARQEAIGWKLTQWTARISAQAEEDACRIERWANKRYFYRYPQLCYIWE